MLWTIIPEEEIFAEDGSSPGSLEVTVAGVTLLVEPQQFGQAKIVRLISTDPEHYLHPALQPGQVIDLLAAPHN